MPFPGSQHTDHVSLAYSINQYIWLTRVIGGLLMLIAFTTVLSANVLIQKIVTFILILVSASIIYLTTFVMLADKMFYQPETKLMKPMKEDQIERARLIIGLDINGDHRAYPIELLAYHHQVLDTVGGMPVMVTYCSVCRTAMVFKPEVNGQSEKFRLVGMDQFNAMFEDSRTHSWWRQATGECCAGPLKGQKLPLIPYRQMTLEAWQNLYPTTLVMQPDPKFQKQYDGLRGYDDGTRGGDLTGTDTASFHPKSWVVILSIDNAEKAYDWNELRQKDMISDNIGKEPIILVLDTDRRSYYAFSRKIKDVPLTFTLDKTRNQLIDSASSSIWDMKGECIEGAYKGQKLSYINAYQEFYHSSLTFHPGAVISK